MTKQTEIKRHSDIDDSYLKDHGKSHDPRYFSMLNNAVAVKDNKQYEGGNAEEALAYEKYLLTLELPNCPISFNLSAKQFSAAENTITNLIEIEQILQKHYRDSTINTSQCLDEVINFINKTSQESGVAYLPSGWTNPDGGHFAGLKLRKLTNSNYVFSVINHGSGMEYHRLLSTSGDKNKLSYQSDEFEVDFTSKDGHELLQKLIELRYDMQRKRYGNAAKIIHAYSADDLYGLLILYGKKIPSIDKINEKSVTQQRTGTCTMTNAQAIAHDTLVDNDVQFTARKRFDFVIKLRSLIDGFYAYRQGRYALNILEWGLNEFSVRINKRYDALTAKEIIYCSQLREQIQKHLDQDKQAAITKKCAKKSLPNLEGNAPQVKNTVFDLAIVKASAENIGNSEYYQNNETANKITPNNVSSLINNLTWSSPDSEVSKKIYALLNSLPHCTGLARDKFWDKVAEDELHYLISSLFNAAQKLSSREDHSPPVRARSFAMALIIYDIAAQLAPRSDKAKLGDTYAFGLDDIYSEQYFLADPIAYHTVKRVAKNFEQRAKNKERILTNAVNYDNNKHDNTVYYVIRVLLTQAQREVVAQALMKKKNMESSNFRDEELFDHLMQHLDLRNDQYEKILDTKIVELIGIAATAHSLGKFTKSYQEQDKTNGLFCFRENQFHQELTRKVHLESAGAYKWLPPVNRKNADINHQDFSENTIYQNSENLIQEYVEKAQLQPYQIHLSGSLRPTSTIWQNQTKQQQTFNELNEDFRHIECTPHLQVVRVLAWAKANLAKLNYKEVRIRINELLFQYGKLDSAFADNPETTLLMINNFLIAALQHYQDEAYNDSELLIWVTNLAFDLRYNLETAAKFYKFPLNKIAWPSYRELLLTQIKAVQDTNLRSTLASQLVRSYRNSSPLSVENCCLLLTCRMIANLGDDATSSEDVWQSFNAELLTILLREHNIPKVTAELKNLFPAYLKLKSVDKWQFKKSQLVAIDSNFILDLHKGELQKKDIRTIKERTEKTIADNKELFTRLKLTTENIKLLHSGYWEPDEKLPASKDEHGHAVGHLLKSADDNWEFAYWESNNQFKITSAYQILNLEKTKLKFKLLNVKEIETFFGKITNPFESTALTDTNYQYWLAAEDPNSLFVRQQNSEVAYCYTLTGYDMVLMSINRWETLDLDELKKTSVEHNNKPILLQHCDEISIYGFSAGIWQLTSHLNRAIFHDQLSFPEAGKILEIKKNAVPKEIYNEITAKNGHITLQNSVISQLKPSETGEWQRNDQQLQLLLNLTDPQIELETEWSATLSPLLGSKNIRCIVALSADKSTYRLQSIEHLELGLSFTANKDNQLVCNEIPDGYFLSGPQSLQTLNGLPSVITLENTNGNKKYLLPAFSLNSGETNNNAFNQENIIDYASLCNKSPCYYLYSLNLKNELESNSIEANLYLAILYRSQGDFKNAIKFLERCNMHKTLTATVVAIALQVLTRKIQSPLGAAFDLKLACYLEDQQNKWAKDNEKLIQFPKEWTKWVDKQLNFYKNTFSNYKNGIAIIPTYCRLTDYELKLLVNTPINPNESTAKKVEQAQSLNLRLNKASKLPASITDGFSWRQHIDAIQITFQRTQNTHEGLSYHFSSLRLYAEGENTAPSLNYILHYFPKLFEAAISCDPTKLAKLRKTLFSLLQNDADPKPELFELVALLIFSYNHLDYFKKFHIPSMNFDVIRKIGEVFCDHKEEIKNEFNYLLEDAPTVAELSIEKALPSDFTAAPVKFAIDKISYEQECKQPLAAIRKRYFTKNEIPVADQGFALELSGLPNTTLLQLRLFNHFKKGHEENQKKTKPDYKFNDQLSSNDVTFALAELKQQNKQEVPPLDQLILIDLKLALKESQLKDKNKLAQFEASLQKNANWTPLDDDDASENDITKAHNLKQARASDQKPIIQLNDLFTAFLQQKPALLTERNPFLTQKVIERLFAELADYALLQSRVDQAQQALNIIADKTSINEIESYESQLLASTIDKPRAYNVQEYPEFLVYEYATQRLLRADQIDVLTKIIKLIESDALNDEDLHHCLLQFAAGGGKTSVLIPILAQRFARKGYLPIIFNTNELYPIGLQDVPANLRASFQQNMEVIERELEHVWTVKELTALGEDLEHWRTEGKCLLIKPVTWHSINIARKMAYTRGDSKLGNAASDVLDFFKNKTVKLEDECQIVSDSLQQCIKTSGIMQKIPDEQLNLVLRCYDYLMGHEKNSEAIAKLANNLERSITVAELDELQNKLIDAIKHEEVFKDVNSEDLDAYLRQPNRERPHWLVMLSYKREKTADLIVLARAFIKTHLPHILSLRYLVDYGKSIHDGDLTVAPKHEGKDVTSHYGDHTLVVALTTQLYQQRGLLPEQTEQFLDQLIKEHNQERQGNKDVSEPTQAEQLLFRLIPANYDFTTCRDLTAKMKAHLAADSNFFKNPEVIQKYLLEFALPQIKVPSERHFSTAAELQAGFKRSILLSATPSLPETYPPFLDEEKNCFLEAAFEAQVIDTLLKQENSKHVIGLKKTKNPTDFFKQIPPKLLATITTFLDRGGLLTDFKVEEIIKDYLGLDQSATASKTAAFFSGQNLFLKSEEVGVKDMKIDGARLIEALKSQGIRPEQFILFLFLDLSKTTGTDIKRPYDDHAGLTVGKGQTVTETIQAAMRERQLLDKDAQTITWLMFQALYSEINPKSPEIFDPHQVFYWMIKNEAQQIETKLINRAYQSIYQAVSEIAWQKLKNNPADKYKPRYMALQQWQSLSPYSIYELAYREENTELVLQGYLESLCKSFEFTENDILAETQLRIKKVIKQTSDLIPTLQNPPKTQLTSEVQQEQQTEMQIEQEQQQQQRMKTKLDEASDFVFELEQYSDEKDNLIAISDQEIRQNSQHYQALRLPNCNYIKQPELLFCPTHFAVTRASGKDEEAELRQLKPIEMMLVQISPDHKLEFLACTAAGAEHYAFLLNNNFLSENDPSYAMLSASGEVLHKSNNSSVEKWTKLTEEEDCQKMLAYANFLNGKISDRPILRQLIKEQAWTKNDYESLVNAISTVHVSQHSVSLLNNHALEKECGWETDKAKFHNSDTVSKRYENYKTKNKLRTTTIITETLRPLVKLENNINVTEFPPSSRKTAIEGYVLDQTPNPASKTTDELELAALVREIQTLPISNIIAEKNQAINNLNTRVKTILKFSRPLPETIQTIRKLCAEFKEFDQLLQNLHNKILKHANSAEYSVILKDPLIKTVKDAYLDIDKGQSIDIFKADLQKKLDIFGLSDEQTIAIGIELIQNIVDFNNVLKHIKLELRTAVYEAFQEKLPDMLKEPFDYVQLAEFLSLEQYSAVCIKQVNCMTDYSNAVNTVIAKEKTNKIYETYKHKIPHMLKTVTDFKRLNLSTEQSIEICKLYPEILFQILDSPADLINLFRGLAPELYGLVCKICRIKFPAIINELTSSLELTDEQFTAVYDVYQNNFLQEVNGKDELNNIIGHVSKERQEEIQKSIECYVDNFEKMYNFIFPTGKKSNPSFFSQPKPLDFLNGKTPFEKFFLLKEKHKKNDKPKITQAIDMVNNNFNLHEDNKEKKLIYQGDYSADTLRFIFDLKRELSLDKISAIRISDIHIDACVRDTEKWMEDINLILPGSIKNSVVVKKAYVNAVVDETFQVPMGTEAIKFFGPLFRDIATGLAQGTSAEEVTVSAETHLVSLFKVIPEEPIIEMEQDDFTLRLQ